MVMNTGFKSQCLPTYRVLTQDQINTLHCATLELLETVGVKIMHEEAVQMMADAGCRVKKDNIVQIPNYLVEEAIISAPSRITIYNRLGKAAMHLEGNKTYFGMGTDLVKTYDLKTGELRESQLRDVANAARIADYLEEIDFTGSYALPFDSPTNLAYIDSFKAQLENCVKPIFYTAAGMEDMAVIHDMAAAVMGGNEALREKPIHIHYAEPLTPLMHSSGAIDKLFFCADNGSPVNYTPGMMSGASAPVTLAGAVTVGNAEALSGVVMHQLRAKGAPIISGFGMSTLDMKAGTCIYGCPEYRLALSACSDLYHYYGIPMWGTAGVSDANCIDQQAGMEWAMSLLMAGLDGANLIHDIAYMGQGLVGSPAALVMNAEIISYVRRVIKGFDIDAEHIGMDVIKSVGPQGGFLTTDQTMKFFKDEHWQPHLSNRTAPDIWAKMGSKTWGQNATQKALDILNSHQAVPLDREVQESLDAMREKAFIDLDGKQFES
ncbi:trimethylamine---corrinoid protein Co-methyltransferase [Desulfocicer vacuolatum DSM 3385]|uniref:Trimethylamine---corrinoid protein Co-methyltransferase n=1 Tax=Desulfocicer vacuolatum DSM 3385 TaxID=1121400 RepID=A0A1W2ET45_9BACT|nr:trimethylamine methyltransferase family protein [Desulfocicer vacuolatum]SMD12867.1 trimethylamine---corrinoid protein Co-methyltransferase [Desulfocicer vacuolatum DSM 3385]